MKLAITILLILLMISGAIGHIVKPRFYKRMVPDFISLRLANILSTIVEGAIGILLLLPEYRSYGALAFMLLMIAFLPIHIWDLTKERPAVGSKKAAVIRLIFQFLFIYAGWWLYKA